MSLYPFPVAGHQINIGVLLPMAMVPVIAFDVLVALQQRSIGRHLPVLRSRAPAVLIVLAVGALFTLRSAREYWQGEPLGLPGTQLIRVDRGQADRLRWVVAQLSSCASSYSVPGMMSFTLWSGHSLLTPINVNNMLAFVNEKQQNDIINTLANQDRLCIIYNPEFLDAFDRGQIRKDPPILNYIRTNFVPFATYERFVIFKRRVSGP